VFFVIHDGILANIPIILQGVIMEIRGLLLEVLWV